MALVLDSLQKFIFEKIDIRGEIVHLGNSYATIIQQHHYPPIIERLLGEALVAVTLLTATLKFKGQLTIQFHGAEPIKMLVAKCTHDLHIRALAQFSPEANEDSIEQAFSSGQLVITIDPDDRVKPYQSIISLEQQSIATCLEDYFARSEQLSTRIWLATGEQRAAGVLLQLLPEQSSQERELFWEHAIKLGETITQQELLTLDNETLLYRLYHSEKIRLFTPAPVSFRCNCAKEKMLRAIQTLGQTDAEKILADKPVIAVNCEYCNTEFCFDKVDVANLFA